MAIEENGVFKVRVGKILNPAVEINKIFIEVMRGSRHMLVLSYNLGNLGISGHAV